MEHLYRASSKVAGEGLFTKHPIPAKSIIFHFTGALIEHDYTPEFALEGANWIGVGDRKWIIPEPESPVLYLNHSCSPNVFISPNQEIVSVKPIAAHSELFLDYSSTELDPFWQMKCYCGSAECRHIIRNFFSLSLVKQLQYRNYIPKIFWEKVEQNALK